MICLPTEHQGVHKNSFKKVRALQDRIEIWKYWFLRRKENRSTRRKTSRSRVENQQQTQRKYDAGSGNRTRDTLVGGERSQHCAFLLPVIYTCRPLSRGGHFESQGNKKLCFCTSSLALNERLDVQNLLFEHCVIKVYWRAPKITGSKSAFSIFSNVKRSGTI